MPTARIITHNPESTESLAEYLRAEGYDIVYALPEEPQSSSGELTIAVEDCLDHAQAILRAQELAASRGCDVFVGEGIVEALDLSALQIPQAQAAEPLGAEGAVSGADDAEIATADFAIAPPEVPDQIPDFVPGEAQSAAPSGQDPLHSEEETIPSAPAADPEATYSEAMCREVLEAVPEKVTVRREQPMQLGRRALRGARELLGLRMAAWLEWARSSSQVLKIRASAKLEQILLWQQLRAAALTKRREEQRRLTEQKQRDALQQAALDRNQAQQRFARRWQQAGRIQPEAAISVIAKCIQTIRERLSLSLGNRLSGNQDGGGKVTSIRSSQQEVARRQVIRDWKMAFTGAGVAAVLVLFVLGVFSGHSPATTQIQTAQKALQLSTTGRPDAHNQIPLAAAPATAAAVINPQANSILPAKPAPAIASSNASQSAAAKPMPASKVREANARRSRSHQVAVEAEDSEPEVIVRHFSHGNTRPRPKVVAGVKHYSDLD